MNTKPATYKIDDSVSTAAAEWLMQLKTDAMTPEIEKRFYVWLVEDPAHLEAYESMLSIWNDLGALDTDLLVMEDLEAALIQAPLAPTKRWRRRATDWVQKIRTCLRRGMGGLPSALRLRRLGFALTWPRAMASSVAVVLIVAGVWLIQPESTTIMMNRTGTGEQKTLYLSDSSTVYLDTETVISSSFTKDMRHIELLRGRALFLVAHDPNRPFIVTAGDVSVRAVGTHFNIYKALKGKVAVAVTEGRVLVSRKETAAPIGKKILSDGWLNEIVDTGQEIVIDDQSKVYEIKPVDAALVTEWKDGRLTFYKQPLPEVIEEINRYLEKKMYIADDRLNTTTINLTLKIAYRHHFIGALEKVIPITSRITSNGTIVIFQKEG